MDEEVAPMNSIIFKAMLLMVLFFVIIASLTSVALLYSFPRLDKLNHEMGNFAREQRIKNDFFAFEGANDLPGIDRVMKAAKSLGM